MKKNSSIGDVLSILFGSIVVVGVIQHFYAKSLDMDLPESEYYSAREMHRSYNKLISDESIKVYKTLERKVYRKPDEDRHNLLCEFTDVDRSQVYLGYRAFTDDHPEVFWISIGFGLRNHTGIYSIYPKDELKEKKEEF